MPFLLIPLLLGAGLLFDTRLASLMRASRGVGRAWWDVLAAIGSWVVVCVITPLITLAFSAPLAATIWLMTAPAAARRLANRHDAPVSLPGWVRELVSGVREGGAPRVLLIVGATAYAGLLLTIPFGVHLYTAPVPWLYAVVAAVCINTLVITSFSRAASGIVHESARAQASSEGLATITGVRAQDLIPLIRQHADGAVSVEPAPPVTLARGLARVADSVMSVMPDMELVELSPARLLLVPVTAETAARRELLASSDGMIEAAQVDGADVRLTLAAGISPSAAERVEAWGHAVYSPEHALVEWDAPHRTATLRALSAAERQVRERLAQVLKVTRPYDLSCTVTEAEGRIDQVILHRVPAGLGGVDRTARTTFWKVVSASLPSGSNGWSVDEDELGAVTLTWGPARSLPGTVPLAEILPSKVDPADWASLPIGRSETGSVAKFDLTLGPHSLSVGPTGSGKTIMLNALITGALSGGHTVVVVDGVKRGVDFRPLQPYLAGFATSMESALQMLESVYAEGQRRVTVLEDHGAVKWDDLSADIRAVENIAPLTVVVDEVGSMLAQVKVPSSLPKDDSRRIELEERAMQKDLIIAILGKIARELRFVGVHLALATQRPDAAILSGELRSNLTSVCQLARPGKLPKREALAMLFDGDDTALVAETLTALDDGHSRGLGVIAGDGGSVEGVRVAYAPATEIPALLDAIGVPRNPRQLPLVDAGEPTKPAVGQIISAEPEVVEHGDLDLSDLDLSALTTPAENPFAGLFESEE